MWYTMNNADDTLRQLARNVVRAMYEDAQAQSRMLADELKFRATMRAVIDKIRSDARHGL